MLANLIKRIFVLTLGLSPAAGNAETLVEAERRLGTDGSSQQYHELVINPYQTVLSTEGFIIGIEKTRKGVVGYPYNVKEHDRKRLKLWAESGVDSGSIHSKARDYHIRRVTHDPKVMYVSHILQYEPTDTGGSMGTHPFYMAYQESGFPASESEYLCPDVSPNKGNEYETGWNALDCLFHRIDDKLSTAPANRKFTHLFVLSMGWNNNQIVSLQRYNALMSHIKAQANAANNGDTSKFRPLVIGLTWPSVWGGTAFSNVVNKVTHIGSYSNKSDDADEIGYGVANYVVNDLVPRLRKKHTFSTVVLGHSFGARILSRAFHSGHLLRSTTPEDEKLHEPTLMINLQGAYSARRYNVGYTQPFHKRLFHEGEGAPYIMDIEKPGKIVLTWSSRDGANPVARYLTGAVHVGGWRGYKELRDNVGPPLVDIREIKKDNPILVDCNSRSDMSDVIMADATEFVLDHNDVFNKKTGEFLWSAISCFDNNQ